MQEYVIFEQEYDCTIQWNQNTVGKGNELRNVNTKQFLVFFLGSLLDHYLSKLNFCSQTEKGKQDKTYTVM